MPTYQFKIQLQDIKDPAVWRRVLVSPGITLHEFHVIIQAAFGWDNYHYYSFSPKGWNSTIFFQLPDPEFDDESENDIEDSESVELSGIFTAEKQTFIYIYDFGDDWKHKITLEKILEESTLNPICTGGKGTCPPEDCGGPWGYQNLLATLADPKSPEYKDMRSWLGLKGAQKWDADAFDIGAANEALRTSV